MSLVRVKVPATSANLGAGFDTLGIAFQLYNYVDIQHSTDSAHHIKTSGEGHQYKSTLDNNIVYIAIRTLAKHLQIQLPPLTISLINEIPFARGLGSSAAARVGGLVAANLWFEKNSLPHATFQELLELATRLEGHPDNAAPALIGGLTAGAVDNNNIYTSKLNIKLWPQFMVFIPNMELATSKARAVLPEQLSRHDATFNLSRLGLLLATLSNDNWTDNQAILTTSLQDKIHQNQRSQLIPGYHQIENAAKINGALGVTLSGAGPSILVWLPPEAESTFKENIAKNIIDAALAAGTDGIIRELDVDLDGCREI